MTVLAARAVEEKTYGVCAFLIASEIEDSSILVSIVDRLRDRLTATLERDLHQPCGDLLVSLSDATSLPEPLPRTWRERLLFWRPQRIYQHPRKWQLRAELQAVPIAAARELAGDCPAYHEAAGADTIWCMFEAGHPSGPGRAPRHTGLRRGMFADFPEHAQLLVFEKPDAP